ncbi:MAG TPA: zf-TFIIB domain-containing protein [Solirubrobacteraceae bacterium]|nr:zf-TFIIB domain-containing protein [Solirubrobacteraceae bacterium]
MRSYERSGVQVDQCEECRGLFLDRGELERLIDAEPPRSDRTPYDRSDTDEHSHDRDRHDDDHTPQRGRRGGFLADLLGGGE